MVVNILRTVQYVLVMRDIVGSAKSVMALESKANINPSLRVENVRALFLRSVSIKFNLQVVLW